MKIAITCPIYVNTQSHEDFVNKTTLSIKTKHEFAYIPVENHIASKFNPFEYQFTQEPNELHVLKGRQPQAVAKAWNDGITKGIEVGCKYIIVCNQDIRFRFDAIDKLVELAENNVCPTCKGTGVRSDTVDPMGIAVQPCSCKENPYTDIAIWSMGQTDDFFNIDTCVTDENWSEHPNFSAYMVRSDFFSHVGEFDEKNFIPAYYEDNDMHARLSLANKKAIIYGGAKFFHFGSGTMRGDANWQRDIRPSATNCQQNFVQKWGMRPVHESSQMRRLYYSTPYDEPTLTLADW